MKGQSIISAPLALLAAVAQPSAVSAISWSMGTSSCDGNPFENLTISITCDNSTTCDLGDTAVVSGSLAASGTFSNSNVTLRPCIYMTSYCPEDASTSAGTLCGDWLDPLDGQSCGQAGAYAVSYSQDIPSSDNVPSGMSYLLSSVITVHMEVYGDDDECTVVADNMTQMSMSYSMAGMILIGAAAYSVAKRWNQRKAEEEGEEDGHSFVEMRDNAAVV